jgi:pimeloyl-ACP methyl ester carboxylesterase
MSATKADAHPHAPLKAPGWRRMALEARAPLEFAASVAAAPWLINSPRGDGHPVIVYPGFMASDVSTAPMRRLLRHLGHDVHGWGQGRNVGARIEAVDLALQRIEALHARTGRKVSLVGWSLGGIYAREFAKRVPHAVRAVVTLGSPFTGSLGATNAWRVYQWINGGPAEVAPDRAAMRLPPPVPTTSIYSRSDGVVAWQCSLEEAGPMSENIEVAASHLGLGVNPLALHALADRLAQPEGQWRPFARTGAKRFVYRAPHTSSTPNA